MSLVKDQFDPKSLIVGEDFEPHWQPDLSDVEYHADKSAVGSSSVRQMLRSPKAFLHSFLNGSEPTDPMKFGTLAHMAILEGDKFRERYVVMPEFVGYTKTGERTTNPNATDIKIQKAQWLESVGPDAVIVTTEERDHLFGMIESVVNHKDAFALLKDGKTEISGYYRDPETGIKCKIRPDFLGFNLGVLADVKTTTDCDMSAFSKSIGNLQYHVQMAMYCEGASIISGKKIEFPAYIAIEKKAPYEVEVYVADEAMMEIGTMEYHKALRALRKAIDTDTWTRPSGLKNIGLPHWFIQNYQA